MSRAEVEARRWRANAAKLRRMLDSDSDDNEAMNDTPQDSTVTVEMVEAGQKAAWATRLPANNQELEAIYLAMQAASRPSAAASGDDELVEDLRNSEYFEGHGVLASVAERAADRIEALNRAPAFSGHRVDILAKEIEAALCYDAERTPGAIWADERGRGQMRLAARTAIEALTRAQPLGGDELVDCPKCSGSGKRNVDELARENVFGVTDKMAGRMGARFVPNELGEQRLAAERAALTEQKEKRG